MEKRGRGKESEMEAKVTSFNGREKNGLLGADEKFKM